MKKYLFILLLLSGLAYADCVTGVTPVTPNLGLYKPFNNECNWGLFWNLNADILDSLSPGAQAVLLAPTGNQTITGGFSLISTGNVVGNSTWGTPTSLSKVNGPFGEPLGSLDFATTHIVYGDGTTTTNINGPTRLAFQVGYSDYFNISSGAIHILSTVPLQWSTTAGLSFLGASSLALGNGTLADTSGSLSLTNLVSGPALTFNGSWPSPRGANISAIRAPASNLTSDWAVWAGSQPSAFFSGIQDIDFATKAENVFSSISGHAIALYGVAQNTSVAGYQAEGVSGQATAYLIANGTLAGAIGGHYQANVVKNGFTLGNTPSAIAVGTEAYGDQGVAAIVGLSVGANGVPAGGTVTGTNDGIRISSQAGVSSVRNAAIRILDQGTAATDYAIYVAGGKSLLLGTLDSCAMNGVVLAESTCYPTLQAAHDALPATGGKIFVPLGTITGQRLTVSKPNVELYGIGEGSIIDVSGDLSSTAILTINASGFKIHDLYLNGNSVGGGTAVCMRLGNSSALTSNHSVYGLRIANCGSVALLVSWANNFTIHDNVFTGLLQRSCVRVGDGTNPVTNGTIYSNECTNPDELAALSDSGFHVNGSTSSLIVSHITWQSNRVHITDGGALTARACFQLNNIKDSSVIYNYCDKAIDATHGSGGEGIAFTGENILVEGNSVSGSAVVGILEWLTANGYKHHQIKNNFSYNNAAGFAIVVAANGMTATDIQITGNHAWDAGAGTQTVGLESYLGPGVTTISYANVAAFDNFFDGNINQATNMWPGLVGTVQLSNNQSAADPALVVTSTTLPDVIFGPTGAGLPRGQLCYATATAQCSVLGVAGDVVLSPNSGSGNLILGPTNSNTGAIKFQTVCAGCGGEQFAWQITKERHFSPFDIPSFRPAVSACGTTPAIIGSDNSFKITIGTGGVATSCTVTFATSFGAYVPNCTANSDTDIVALKVNTSATQTVISASGAFTASSKLSALCF